MANTGAALQSAARTFYSTFLALKENKRQDERDAEEDRWRRATMAMQEKQEARLAAADARQGEMQERNLKLLDGQIADMERSQGEVQKFIDEMGFSPEMWAQKSEVEKFEMAKEMHALTKEQIQVNMAATQAASAYRRAMLPFEQRAAEMSAKRAEMGFEMDQEEYNQFKATKGIREAEGLVGTIQKRLDSTNDILKGYMDDFGALSPDTPQELLDQRKELTGLMTAAVTNKFTPEMYKSLGIDPEQVKAKSASSEAELEAGRIQKMYGAAGASIRDAEERAKVVEERAKKVFDFFYVDEQGKLQGTKDPQVIQALEKKAPDRILDSRYVHGYMVGQPYPARKNSTVVKGLFGSGRYELPTPYADSVGLDYAASGGF